MSNTLIGMQAAIELEKAQAQERSLRRARAAIFLGLSGSYLYDSLGCALPFWADHVAVLDVTADKLEEAEVAL